LVVAGGPRVRTAISASPGVRCTVAHVHVDGFVAIIAAADTGNCSSLDVYATSDLAIKQESEHVILVHKPELVPRQLDVGESDKGYEWEETSDQRFAQC
jgi:hypothetical protein